MLRRYGQAAESVLHHQQRDPVERRRAGIEGCRSILRFRRQNRQLGPLGHDLAGVDAGQMLAEPALESQPAPPDRREVLAPRRHLDAVSRAGEKGGQRSADRPCSEHRDAHPQSLDTDVAVSSHHEQ